MLTYKEKKEAGLYVHMVVEIWMKSCWKQGCWRYIQTVFKAIVSLITCIIHWELQPASLSLLCPYNWAVSGLKQDGWLNAWIDGRMDGWDDRTIWLDEWTDDCMDGRMVWINGWLDGWLTGWIEEWFWCTDGWMMDVKMMGGWHFLSLKAEKFLEWAERFHTAGSIPC